MEEDSKKMNNSKMPLWQEISIKLEEDIKKGDYKAGELLPSEAKLEEQYAVSRITAKNAINRLVNLKLVKRTRGLGTQVLDIKINEPLLKIEGFTKEMSLLGIYPTTVYASIKIVRADGYVAKQLEIEEKSPVYALTRVRCINGQKVGYFETYLIFETEMSLDSSIYYNSLYTCLKEKGIIIDWIKQTVSAELADKDTMHYLEMAKGKPVLTMCRKGYMNEKPVEFSICKYNAEKYDYYFELRNEM